MKKLLLGSFLLLLIIAPAFAVAELNEAQKVTPQAQVKMMVDSILDVLRQPELGGLEKKELVSGMMQEFLNVESMSRRTLASHWQEASVEQQQRFSDLFVKILEGTYLNRIGDYSGGNVEYLKQRVKGDQAIIETLIVAEELEIPVDYMMIYVDNTWQVFDLVIEGVSLVRNYRSSYGEIIRRDGYDGLLTLMAEKVEAMNVVE